MAPGRREKRSIVTINLFYSSYAHNNLELHHRIAKKLGIELTGTMRLYNGCAVSRGFRYSAASRTKRVKTRSERAYVDLVEPTLVATKEGKRYAIVCMDYFSRYSWMHLLASKQDTFRVLERFLADTRIEESIKIISTNNGSEFREGYGANLDPNTMKREYIPPSISESNGVI